MSDLRREIVRLARAEIGIREMTGRNDGIPLVRYQQRPAKADGSGWPWCAAFAIWCWYEADADVPRPGSWDSIRLHDVNAAERWAEESGMWHFNTPSPGDWVFFDRRGGSDAGPGRHMGIVAEAGSPALVTVEGNWANAVTIKTRLRGPGHELEIVGYASPRART